MPIMNVGLSKASILHSTASALRQSLASMKPIDESIKLPIPNQTVRSLSAGSGGNQSTLDTALAYAIRISVPSSCPVGIFHP